MRRSWVGMCLAAALMALLVTDAENPRFSFDEGSAGVRLDQAIAERMPGVSRTRIQKWIVAGSVLVNGEKVLSSYSIRPGDTAVVDEPVLIESKALPEQIPLDVRFEDDDLLVINKPAGMAVHPGKGVHSGTVVNALLGREHSLSVIGGVMRPGIVHRLDKDTTGLMMVAKNDFAHKALSNALQKREVSRRYVALALRSFAEDQGTVEAPMGRNPKNRLKMSVGDGPDAREARTHWRVLERFKGVALIECKLDTGRTHQIRVHMAHIGHPILGDVTYGGLVELAVQLISPYDTSLRAVLRGVPRQMLHAHELKFVHPRTGETVHIKQAPPADYLAVVERLRQGAAG